MDIRSALNTMPSCRNFRTGILPAYERIFSLVSIGGIRRGEADWDTREVAALAIRKAESDKGVFGCLFDIPREELPAYLEREHRYRLEEVEVEVRPPSTGESSSSPRLRSSAVTVSAFTVVSQTDEEYKSSMSAEEYSERVTKYYDGPLWGRSDILPMREYANKCIFASGELGPEWEKNMLVGTLLADGQTRLIDYFHMHPNRLCTDLKWLLDRHSSKNNCGGSLSSK